MTNTPVDKYKTNPLFIEVPKPVNLMSEDEREEFMEEIICALLEETSH